MSDDRLEAIARHPFRAKFHLRAHERAQVQLRGMAVIRRHAVDFIAERVAPAAPRKDGRQTPWGGHPVFVAQHATATCCRGCLERWHGIPKGRELSADEQARIVEIICGWIEREVADGPRRRSPPAAARR